MTPYRISAREEKPREAVPRKLATSLRFAGGSFVVMAVAFTLSMAAENARDLRLASFVSGGTERVFAIVLPLVVIAIGARASRGTLLRKVAFVTAGAWLATFVARFSPVELESTGIACGAALVRVLAITGLGLIPLVAAPRRVLPRWPLFAAMALAAGDAADKLALGHLPMLFGLTHASLTTIVLCALLGWTFFRGARALFEETIDDQAERVSEGTSRLFPDAGARAAFLGPVRLASDAALAFAVAAAGHSHGFRLDEHTAGVECSALVVLVMAALVWHHRSWERISAAPIVAAVFATIAAVLSTFTGSTVAFNIALLLFGLAILGLGVVAPRTTDPETRTVRRWAKLVSASGVLIASAGFFVLYSRSSGQGAPFLAQLAKIGAVVLGIMAANASAKIELHARIELAAEDREP